MCRTCGVWKLWSQGWVTIFAIGGEGTKAELVMQNSQIYW